MSLRYRGGDPCPASYGDRSLQLHFQCADDADNVYDAETVQETDLCHYEIFLKSTFGCPKCNNGCHTYKTHTLCSLLSHAQVLVLPLL